MAIFLAGKTKCIVCRKAVGTAADAIGIPAFIPKGHILAPYSDSVFHKECFSSWSGSEKLRRLYEQYREVWNNRPQNPKSRREMENGDRRRLVASLAMEWSRNGKRTGDEKGVRPEKVVANRRRRSCFV